MQIISTMGSLLKRFGDAALPDVEAIAQKTFINMLMQPERSDEDRWYAMLLISDMVEHAPASSKYIPQLLPKFLEFATSNKPELSLVCCYSLGVVAEKHPQARPCPLHTAVQPLRSICEHTRVSSNCRVHGSMA